MKGIKSLVFLFVVLISLSSTTFADEIGTNSSNDVNQGIVIQYYDVIHSCHEGPYHQDCRTSTMVKSCGCTTTYYQCCCGKTNSVFYVYCKLHQY